MSEPKRRGRPPKVKAEAAKPEPKVQFKKADYDFQDCKYDDCEVYTAKGVGVIKGADKAAKKFRVKITEGENAGKSYAMGEGSVRFKAVNDKYRESYVHCPEIRTESGNVSIHTGDDVSYTLLGYVNAELAAIARENGLGPRWKAWAERLNPGMCRMNLGNMLRKMENPTFGGKSLSAAKAAREVQIAKIARDEAKKPHRRPKK